MEAKAIKEALRAEGFDVDSVEFTRAMRKVENPAGCEFCGARTKVGVGDAKGKIVLACCKRDITAKPSKEKS